MFESEIELIKESYERALGTGHILYLFIIFALYIVLFCKEKDNRIRVVFGIYSVILFLLFLTPYYAKIFSNIMGNSVYYRNFWILPITLVVAYGLTEIVYTKFETTPKKVFAIIASIFVIIICGGYAYHPVYFGKVNNYYKLPDDVLEVVQHITEDEEDYKCLAGPNEFQIYTRQIDANIKLSDGRSMSEIYGKNSVVTALEKNDSEKVSQLCYKNNYNYLVIPTDKIMSEDMETLGFDLIMDGDVYLLYKMNSEKMEELYNK